jgi:hypothetical protein
MFAGGVRKLLPKKVANFCTFPKAMAAQAVSFHARGMDPGLHKEL